MRDSVIAVVREYGGAFCSAINEIERRCKFLNISAHLSHTQNRFFLFVGKYDNNARFTSVQALTVAVVCMQLQFNYFTTDVASCHCWNERRDNNVGNGERTSLYYHYAQHMQ